MDRVHAPDFDPATTAILDQEPPCTPGPPDAGGTASLLSHDATTWRIQTNSPVPTVLVLAEAEYAGWQVTVDGEPAQPLTAYTALRAVCVPAGEHTVVWHYRPRAVWVGGAVTAIASILLIAAALTVNRRQPTEPALLSGGATTRSSTTDHA